MAQGAEGRHSNEGNPGSSPVVPPTAMILMEPQPMPPANLRSKKERRGRMKKKTKQPLPSILALSSREAVGLRKEGC